VGVDAGITYGSITDVQILTYLEFRSVITVDTMGNTGEDLELTGVTKIAKGNLHGGASRSQPNGNPLFGAHSWVPGFSNQTDFFYIGYVAYGKQWLAVK